MTKLVGCCEIYKSETLLMNIFGTLNTLMGIYALEGRISYINSTVGEETNINLDATWSNHSRKRKSEKYRHKKVMKLTLVEEFPVPNKRQIGTCGTIYISAIVPLKAPKVYKGDGDVQ